MAGKCFNDLSIYELDNGRSLVNQSNIGTQYGHERCVLKANNPSSDHNDFFRKTTHGLKVIGIHNPMVVKGNLRAVRGSCAASHQDLLSFDASPLAMNFDCVGIEKQRVALINHNPVSRQLRSNY